MQENFIKVTFYAGDKNKIKLAAKHRKEVVVKLNELLKEYSITPTTMGYLHTIILEDFSDLSYRSPYQIIKNRFRRHEIRDLKLEHIKMYKPQATISI